MSRFDGPSAAKDLLRQRLRRARRGLTTGERQAAHQRICTTIITTLSREPPPALASYLALSDEADLAGVHRHWWSLGLPVWLPRVCGPGQLAWHPVTSLEQVACGSYGIQEPDPLLIGEGALPSGAVVLVPGIGFTAAGGRLGQGGGFYDRLLATHRGPAWGVGYACQLVEDLPSEAHDQGLRQLIIDGRLLAVC
jgi:5-formyltetrahydrofolate cyclo-ligase